MAFDQLYSITINGTDSHDCGFGERTLTGYCETCPNQGDCTFVFECSDEGNCDPPDALEIEVPNTCPCNHAEDTCNVVSEVVINNYDCECSKTSSTTACSGYEHPYCPPIDQPDGCGGWWSCGGCEGNEECDEPSNTCECVEVCDETDCAAIGNQAACDTSTYCIWDTGECLSNQCGHGGCGAGFPCGQCDSCHSCTNVGGGGNSGYGVCNPKTTYIYFYSQPDTPYEIGTNGSIEFTIKHRLTSEIRIQYYKDGEGVYKDIATIAVENLENCSYSTLTYEWTGIEATLESNNHYTGTYHIVVTDTGSSEYEKISNAITISDDIRPGCDDPCASNYSDNATDYDNSCTYSTCLNEDANNYLCHEDGWSDANGTVQECHSGSYYCTGGTYVSATDDYSCSFNPIASIDDIGHDIYEGSEITISSDTTQAWADNGYNFGSGTAPTITGRDWIIFDNEGLISIDNTGTQNSFTLPLYTDPSMEYGGGALLTAELTVTNSGGYTDTVTEEFNIYDIDAFGTELSAFSSIYIPGESLLSIIGCYLPPKNGGYVMNDALNNSFYDYSTNPDENDDPDLGTFLPGDFAYVKLCKQYPCTSAEDKYDAGFVYNGSEWLGPDVPLIPGMGVYLETQNVGWFKWTEPEE